MNVRRVLLSAAVCTLTITGTAPAQQSKASGAPTYNAALTKLREGKQVMCASLSSPEPDAYCAVANSGVDCIWIEMQHSTLTYYQVGEMIGRCGKSKAAPMIRVPDALEGDIQKATDLGALGIIVPTVDTVEKAQNAVKWAKFPPTGRRSQGGGQAGRIWDPANYRRTINDNMFMVIMIETPIGVDAADRIAAVPGIDVIFAASSDLGNFSGHPPQGDGRKGDAVYEALVTRIHDATLKAGVKLGGPFAWKDRAGFTFFQGPGLAAFVNAGAPIVIQGGAPAGGGRGARAKAQ